MAFSPFTQGPRICIGQHFFMYVSMTSSKRGGSFLSFTEQCAVVSPSMSVSLACQCARFANMWPAFVFSPRRLEAKILLAQLLQHFTFAAVPGQVVEPSTLNGTLKPKDGLLLQISRRTT